uniref:Reverse transcriptase domain-containing protein n=1 Tax=Haemonchus contortus TaxID=6289 RepID=A0A7I4YD72_HAECO
MNIDSYESLTTRIGRLRSRRCGSTPALTVFVVYAPTSSYDEEELEAFYMDLEKLYREDHTFFKVIVGDFNAEIGLRRTTEELHIATHGMEWNEQGKRSPKTVINWNHFASLASSWEDAVNDNIDEEYDRLVEHLLDCARRAESLKDVKERLSSKTLELIRQLGIARATGNHQQTSELAKLCREAIKEDLKERRAVVMDEAAEAGKSIRKARRNFASYKTKTTSLHRSDGTVTASRRAMEKVIYDFYSDLFDSHVYMPTCHLRQDGYVVPSVLPSEIRHAITSMRNGTAPGPDRIKAEHLKTLPPVIVKTLARLFTRYLSQCKVPTSWKTSKTVLLYKKGDPDDIGSYRPICLLSVIYKLFTRVILNRIGRILDEGQPCEQAGFRRGFSTIDHIHTVTRLIEVSREYKMPLCLTLIDLKKAFNTVETEAVIGALGNQGVPTQYVRMLRELYNNFTTRISPFYKEVIINVKRGVRQGDTISPKLFSAALENVMRHMEWESMEVKVGGRYLHHLLFADDIVLITPNIEKAE